jgi:hypothetical protein
VLPSLRPLFFAKRENRANLSTGKRSEMSVFQMGVTDHIHELATHRLPILSHLGFKYLKSRRAFHRTTKYGRDVIEFLNSRLHLYFGFGVWNDAGKNQEALKYLAEQKELAGVNKWVPDRVHQLAAFSEMI